MDILTAYGPVDRSLVVRDRVLVNNAYERTLSLEYRLKQTMTLAGREVTADEVIKRSAHVHLKQWPGDASMSLGAFTRAVKTRGRGITPSGQQPDQPSKSFLRMLGHMFRHANSQAMCTSFKQELLNGSHAFGTQSANGTRTVTTKDTFKMALYLASGSLGAATTVYSSTSELAGTGNYTQTGNAVTNATVPTTSGTTAYWTPSASVTWANLTSSGSFDAALLYNTASTSQLAVAVFTFGAQSITAGTFTLTMPTNDSSNALIRIA